MEMADYIKKVITIAQIQPPTKQGSRFKATDPFSFSPLAKKDAVYADMDNPEEMIDLVEDMGARMVQANDAVDEMTELLTLLYDRRRSFFINRDDYTAEMAFWLAEEGQLKASFDVVRLSSVRQIFIRFDDEHDAVHFKMRWL